MRQQFTLHANPVCELFGANQISCGDVQSTAWITEYKATNQVSGIPQYYLWSGGISNPLEVIEQITYLLSSSASTIWLKRNGTWQIIAAQDTQFDCK